MLYFSDFCNSDCFAMGDTSSYLLTTVLQKVDDARRRLPSSVPTNDLDDIIDEHIARAHAARGKPTFDGPGTFEWVGSSRSVVQVWQYAESETAAANTILAKLAKYHSIRDSSDYKFTLSALPVQRDDANDTQFHIVIEGNYSHIPKLVDMISILSTRPIAMHPADRLSGIVTYLDG